MKNNILNLRCHFAIIICKLAMWIRINQEPLVCFMNLHMIALGPQYNKVLLREQKGNACYCCNFQKFPQRTCTNQSHLRVS